MGPFRSILGSVGLDDDDERHTWFIHACRLVTICVYDSSCKSGDGARCLEELFDRVFFPPHGETPIDDDNYGKHIAMVLHESLQAVSTAMWKTDIHARRGNLSYDDVICVIRVIYGHLFAKGVSSTDEGILASALIKTVLDINATERELPRVTMGARIEAIRKITGDKLGYDLIAHCPEKRLERLNGLLRAIVIWLLPARKRATEKVFAPGRLAGLGYFVVNG